MTRYEIILKGLDTRIKSIEFFGEQLDKNYEDEQDYSRFYQEIAFFIHYIIKTVELKQLLLELISYGKKIEKNTFYIDAKENFIKQVQTIS